MCRCVVKTTKRFDYVTKLATTTAELRAVASLRSTVFREEYDKLITIASAIASPQKGRILATVEWDRLEKAIANQNDNKNGNGKALLLCVSAWLGGRCDAKVKDTILSEVDRSTLVAQEGCSEEPAPVIGSLDLSTKLPKDVARVVDESQSLSAGVSSVAYVSNVGVLSGARCCGVAGAMLEFAQDQALERGIEYVFTHAHKSEMHNRNLLYFKHGYVVQQSESNEEALKDTVLLGTSLLK